MAGPTLVLAIILLLVPTVNNGVYGAYGDASLWCWLQDPTARLFLFYTVVVAAFSFQSFVIFYAVPMEIRDRLKAEDVDKSDTGSDDLLRSLRQYVYVFLFVWFWGLLNRVADAALGGPSMPHLLPRPPNFPALARARARRPGCSYACAICAWRASSVFIKTPRFHCPRLVAGHQFLRIMHGLCIPGQGFLNACAYGGLFSVIQRRSRRWIARQGCCGGLACAAPPDSERKGKKAKGKKTAAHVVTAYEAKEPVTPPPPRACAPPLPLPAPAPRCPTLRTAAAHTCFAGAGCPSLWARGTWARRPPPPPRLPPPSPRSFQLTSTRPSVPRARRPLRLGVNPA